MTKTDAKAWLARFGDMEDSERHYCEHNHPQCSIDYLGHCLDDVIKIAIPVEDDGENRPG